MKNQFTLNEIAEIITNYCKTECNVLSESGHDCDNILTKFHEIAKQTQSKEPRIFAEARTLDELPIKLTETASKKSLSVESRFQVFRRFSLHRIHLASHFFHLLCQTSSKSERQRLTTVSFTRKNSYDFSVKEMFDLDDILLRHLTFKEIRNLIEVRENGTFYFAVSSRLKSEAEQLDSFGMFTLKFVNDQVIAESDSSDDSTYLSSEAYFIFRFPSDSNK